MILKELDPFPATDDLLRSAGRRAEENMAYYLRRAFADSADIAVLNDLRIEHRQSDGTPVFAQIDHLILHRCGFIIVESKSVSGRVRVNVRGEWTREWGRGERRGMASPILQAKEQATLLRKVLSENAPQLVGKWLGMQVRFGTFDYAVLVAISDNGIIDLPRSSDLPEVCKADQVTERARECIEKQKRTGHVLNLSSSATLSIKQEEMENVCRFLRDSHKPLVRETIYDKRDMPSPAVREPERAPVYTPVSTQPVVVPVSTVAKPVFHCRHCSSEQLGMLWGQYGYYFKCGDCARNTPVDAAVLNCDVCQSKKRIRKSGSNFYVECAPCGAAGKEGASRLLFTNR